MSPKLALSSALSVLLMAGFALCGPHQAASNGAAQPMLAAPSKAALGALPALPSLPGLR
ncbi:MAG: hypothetical protein RLZZ136_1237 [Pseudomonadota bacterium]|jgi:hypothetical protein